jgi:trehalose synthase
MPPKTFHSDLVRIEDYARYVGEKTVERVLNKAAALRDLHVVNINSTYYGGGVSELLSSMTILMNTSGIMTGWRVIQGAPDFFSITKKIHDALQGDNIHLTKRKKDLYESINYENSLRNHLEHSDIIMVHDPQPLPLIGFYRKRCPWIWRCHIDVSHPHQALWQYLLQFIEQYDTVILSLKEYCRSLSVPQEYILPSLDPFSIKNRELSEAEMTDRLNYYKIPTDLPLVVQISRFDRWKDPEGVIQAFKIARKQVPCTLVMLGDIATDDPDGPKIFASLLDQREERIIILSQEDTALVNTLQRKAAVVLQKSIREGFGLSVAEAMWKGTPVIGGNTGGIRYQIKDRVNGFLVDTVNEAADRIVLLLGNRRLRDQMGAQAKESVLKRFLMIRGLEDLLDLFAAFRIHFTLQYPKRGRP